MKNSRFRKPMAFLLALMLCVTMVSPAFAARITLPGSSSSSSYSWSDLWNKIFGKGDDNTTDTDTSEDTSDLELTLIEDETTVAEGTQLRASTYAVTSVLSAESSAVKSTYALAGDTNADSATLKYFPVTMFNYDDRINDATHQAEVDGGLGDAWNGIYFNDGYPATGSYNYTSDEVRSTSTLPYAPHNVWTNKIYNSSDKTANYKFGELALRVNYPNDQVGKRAGYVYNGLVKNQLTNGQIEFNVPEGGIFDSSDTSTKDVYTNVGLPFVYDSATGSYTFDASEDSARFAGTAASNTNLTWNDTAQSNTRRGNGFYPFDDGLSVTDDSADYHFGMIATIPFSMTADGKVSSTNQNDIVFNFAGDDDVWVFIDGKLVLDIGGIHNSVSGSLNFAENTSVVQATTAKDGSGYLNTTDGAVSGPINGKLFNDADGNGVLGMTRETFAATDQHTLTVYYLERGKGASNCKISFNLPMKDTVSVRKTVNSNDSANQPLSSDTLAQINNRDFIFTLYKDDTAVANATYNLYNVDNQYISTASTDANGKFTLKNGQTAKFTGEIDDNTGNSYYVVEEKDGTGWEVPTYTYTAKAANGVTSENSTTDGQSMTVTAKGSMEAEDSIAFTCTNTLTHVNVTSIEANDDKIVIDYGLPVEIDVLANDVAVNATAKTIDETVGITGTGENGALNYGTATIEDGKIKYQLTKQLTGVEVLTYTAKATKGNDSATDTATVYIIPATTMYYEENFTDLIRDSADPTIFGTATNTVQEPGVVGTVDDSPYGSDIAYLDDKTDSNGTSRLYDTTQTGIKFQYTFTGTGTSFFARTDNTSAYMKVVVADAEGKTVATQYRDNVYKATTGTNFGQLYNIPVYTFDAGEYEDANGKAYGYGTYTVTVTLYKASATRGNTFYLDGIRVVNPLKTNDANAAIANSAYASDGEAGMTYLTLRDKLLADADIKYTYETDENGEQVLDENGEPIIISAEPVWNGKNFAVLTDSNGNITSASEYKSDGPKEEVYLYNGQSISFSLQNWDANTNKLYLGLKNPNGTGGTVNINGNVVTINNTVDCYYEISKYAQIDLETKTATFTITAGENSLISVTNIKVTGNPNFIIAGADDIVNGDEGNE